MTEPNAETSLPINTILPFLSELIICFLLIVKSWLWDSLPCLRYCHKYFSSCPRPWWPPILPVSWTPWSLVHAQCRSPSLLTTADKTETQGKIKQKIISTTGNWTFLSSILSGHILSFSHADLVFSHHVFQNWESKLNKQWLKSNGVYHILFTK